MERWRKLRIMKICGVSCQFGIDKSKFKSTENTRQSIKHLSKNRKLYTAT